MLSVFFLSFAGHTNEHVEIDKLAAEPGWHKLLHIQPNGRGAVKSASFWLAHNGRDNPAAELRATIDAFNVAPIPDTYHAQCRFPARYAWLKRHSPTRKMPVVVCPAVERFIQQSLPGDITLVLASGFMSSPGSLFGHTFLRIDPARKQAKLLNKTINFEAQTRGSRGVSYKIKGLFGGFNGRFSLLPFDKQVNRHSRKQLRDLWEWPLQLSNDEKRLLLLHFFEVQGVDFGYVFTLENCVTQLLALIEASKPELNLIEESGYTVMPMQTVQLLHAKTQLLGSPAFRPALDKRLRYQLNDLSPGEILTVQAIVAGKNEYDGHEYSPTRQARVLDTSYDLLRYQRTNELIDKPTFQQRTTPLLAQRRTLPSTNNPSYSQPELQPSLGQGRSRWRLGLKYDESGYQPLLSWRFVHHDLLDPRLANPRGTEVKALDIALSTQSRVQLESLQLFSLRSLPTRNSLIKPSSWQLSTGWRRNSQNKITAYADGGRGMSWGNHEHLFFGLGAGGLETSSSLQKGWRLAAGLQLGWLWTPTPNTGTLLELDARIGIAGDRQGSGRLSLSQHLQISQNLGLRGTAERRYEIQNYSNRFLLSLEWYF